MNCGELNKDSPYILKFYVWKRITRKIVRYLQVGKDENFPVFQPRNTLFLRTILKSLFLLKIPKREIDSTKGEFSPWLTKNNLADV